MCGQLFDRLLDEELGYRRSAGQLRGRRVHWPGDATHIEIGGRRYINFSSNNYLGLTHHPRVLAEAEAALHRYGGGAGASALVTGYTQEHADAEATIAAWKGAAGVVLLPSGYQTAHAVVQTLGQLGASGGRRPRFLIDKLCHASLIDALGSVAAKLRVFPHNNMAKLRRLLEEAETDELQVVMTESIFSMDGDAADLGTIAELKSRHEFVLVLDEAHGSGVYGAGGAGYAAELGLGAVVDVSIVTLSKAMGVAGGAICASRRFCEAVENWGRAYIYSTAIPPMVAAAARAAIEVARDEPQRQLRVRELARRVREAFGRAQLRVPAGDSPIIPIILGEEARALAVSQELRDKGLLAVAIRPPTVARGTSRLRITLSCEHTDEEIERLVAEVVRVVG